MATALVSVVKNFKKKHMHILTIIKVFARLRGQAQFLNSKLILLPSLIIFPF